MNPLNDVHQRAPYQTSCPFFFATGVPHSKVAWRVRSERNCGSLPFPGGLVRVPFGLVPRKTMNIVGTSWYKSTWGSGDTQNGDIIWPWVKIPYAPVNIRFNPTTKIPTKMGGAPKAPKWDPIGFDPQPYAGHVCPCSMIQASLDPINKDVKKYRDTHLSSALCPAQTKRSNPQAHAALGMCQDMEPRKKNLWLS